MHKRFLILGITTLVSILVLIFNTVKSKYRKASTIFENTIQESLQNSVVSKNVEATSAYTQTEEQIIIEEPTDNTDSIEIFFSKSLKQFINLLTPLYQPFLLTSTQKELKEFKRSNEFNNDSIYSYNEFLSQLQQELCSLLVANKLFIDSEDKLNHFVKNQSQLGHIKTLKLGAEHFYYLPKAVENLKYVEALDLSEIKFNTKKHVFCNALPQSITTLYVNSAQNLDLFLKKTDCSSVKVLYAKNLENTLAITKNSKKISNVEIIHIDGSFTKTLDDFLFFDKLKELNLTKSAAYDEYNITLRHNFPFKVKLVKI